MSIGAYMTAHCFGDYRRSDAATREEMEAAALEYAARKQTRPSIWREIGMQQARRNYAADRASKIDLMNLQAAGEITPEQAESYRARHGWKQRKNERSERTCC